MRQPSIHKHTISYLSQPAHLLMPEALVYAHQDKGVTDPAALADLFGVSEETMKIRLGAMSAR